MAEAVEVVVLARLDRADDLSCRLDLLPRRQLGVDHQADVAALARGQGAQGIGPVRTAGELEAALKTGIDAVRAGHVFVIDARVAPEYSRAVSGSLMRHIPQR